MLNTTEQSKTTTKPAGGSAARQGGGAGVRGHAAEAEARGRSRASGRRAEFKWRLPQLPGPPLPARIRPCASDRRQAPESSASPASSPPDRAEHTPASLSRPSTSPPRRPPLAPHLQAQPAPFAPRTLSPPLPSRPLRRPPSGPLRFSHAWWPACTPFHHLSDLGGTKERTCSTVQGGADLRESVWGHAREGCVRARNSEFTSKGQQQHRPPAEFWLNASCSRLRVLGGGIPSGSLGWKRNHVQRSLRRSW